MSFHLNNSLGILEALGGTINANDGLGWFIFWLQCKIEKQPLNHTNLVSIPAAKTAKELNVSIRTIKAWKDRLTEAGILFKLKKQSLYKVNPNYIFKGKINNMSK